MKRTALAAYLLAVLLLLCWCQWAPAGDNAARAQAAMELALARKRQSPGKAAGVNYCKRCDRYVCHCGCTRQDGSDCSCDPGPGPARGGCTCTCAGCKRCQYKKGDAISFNDAYELAIATRKNFLIFVGQRARTVPGCITVECDSHPQAYNPPSVVVGLYQDGKINLLTEYLGRPSADDLARVIEKRPRALAAPPPTAFPTAFAPPPAGFAPFMGMGMRMGPMMGGGMRTGGGGRGCRGGG